MYQFILIVTFFLIAVSPAKAENHENHCRTTLHSSPYRSSLCPDKGNLPEGKTRNLQEQRFLCSVGEKKEIRVQEQFDFFKWADLIKLDQEGRQEAYVMRRQTPAPNWSGDVAYKTVEAWTWYSCDLVQDARLCGEKEECREVTKTRQKTVGTRVVSEQYKAKECERVAKTCWADIPQFESMDCTDEKMHYTAEFLRPSESEWNPNLPEYDDMIPNKYDLLPGEIELLSISNQSGSALRTGVALTSTAITAGLLLSGNARAAVSHSNSDVDRKLAKYSGLYSFLDPKATVKEARNHYEINLSGSATQNAVCRPYANETLKVFVKTLRRDDNVQAANAFKLPESWDGVKLEPIIWQGATLDSGTFIEKARPSKIQVMDTSAAMIKFMAEQSNKNPLAGLEKEDSGKEEKVETKSKGFLKNSIIRIRLVKKRWWWLDQEWSKIYVSEFHGIKPTLHHLSKNNETKVSDLWEVELDGDSPESSLYLRDRNWLFKKLMASPTFVQHLRPNRRYAITVSVYQKGVKFYKKSCDDDPNSWDCQWWAGPLKRTENSYFSKELKIPFSTTKEYDARGTWEQVRDTLNIGESILNWVGNQFDLYK